jgi:hypothetical protein
MPTIAFENTVHEDEKDSDVEIISAAERVILGEV